MRILILESYASATFGGAEKSMSAFSKYLEDSGHEVFLVCEKLGDYDVKKSNILVLNLQPPQVQGVFSYLKSIIAVNRFIKENKIDLLLTHTIHAFPLIRLVKQLTGIKTMVYFKWVHNYNSIGRLNKWGLRGIENYTAINDFVGNYWNSHLKSNTKISYVPDGVSFELLDKAIGKPERENCTQLLYFGRIIEGKGLHLLIKALALLPHTFTLKVLGSFDPKSENQVDADYHSQIQSLVKDLKLEDRIHFEGHVENVHPFILNGSLVVVPSIVNDAQPFAILESFALNCPAIGTDRGGIPAIFKNDNFWYCEPDASSISGKIQDILSMPPQELRTKTQRMATSILNRYNIENTQRQLMELCELISK